MPSRQNLVRERMSLHGHVAAETFIPWIRRYAAKLGISNSIVRADGFSVELDVEGPSELIDMMEIGCSLGPIDVCVETIERTPFDGLGA